MRRFLAALVLIASISSAFALYPFPRPVYVAKAAASCSQATTFLARTSGLSGTQSGAYTTMICGMVTDGTWSLLDALYVFATNTTATANLNLVSTSYALTSSGSPTFTANAGYTGNSSSYLSASSNLSTYTEYKQNSATLGSCDLTSRSTAQAYASLGVGGTSYYAYIMPYYPASEATTIVNGATEANPAQTSSLGSFIAGRTSSSLTTFYVNGSSVGTSATASGAVPTYPIYMLATNNVGSKTLDTLDQIAYAFVGAGMTSTQAANMYSRLHTFLSTVGAPSGC